MAEESNNISNISNDNIEIETNENGEIVRGANVDLSEEIDDSELIAAYDQALKKAKQTIVARNPKLKSVEDRNMNKQNKGFSQDNHFVNNKPSRMKRNHNQPFWPKGKNCRAVYDADGKEYEAVVCSVNNKDQTCEVKFIGYDNRATVPLASLQPSFGSRAINIQKTEAANPLERSSNSSQAPSELNASFYSASSTSTSLDSNSYLKPRQFGSTSSNLNQTMHNKDLPFTMPPMPPPPPFLGNATGDGSDLSTAFISWYMAGYHTGRYEATMEAKQNLEKKSFPKY